MNSYSYSQEYYEIVFRIYVYGYGYSVTSIKRGTLKEAIHIKKLAIRCNRLGIGNKFVYEYLYTDGNIEEVYNIVKVTCEVLKD